jgi:hypothetical protein
LSWRGRPLRERQQWCLRHFSAATIGEAPAARRGAEGPLAPRERHAVWIEGNSRRWERALAIEQKVGVAVCDTDPFKLHYTWSLWRLGKVARDEWEQAAEVSRTAFAERRLGIADLILVELRWPAELRRRSERDRVESGRRRGRFELHQQLGAPLREWYEATDRLDRGRVRSQLPSDGALDPLPMPRNPRSGVALFDALLAELPD